jgi:hypothetical protein
MAKKSESSAEQSKSVIKRLRPWLILAFGLALFYDANPFYSLLMHYGVNLHLPIPQVMNDSWAESTKPNVTRIEQEFDSRIVTLQSDRGPIRLKTYHGERSNLGVIVAGGVAGAFYSPARGLFYKLGESGSSKGIYTAHLCFRHPRDYPETVHDVRAAIQYLNQIGIKRIVVVGHSLGGAAVIGAASFEPSVVGVVPMSSQPYGAERISLLRTRILIISGLLDPVEPPAWSKALYKEAKGDKEIAFFMGSHNLNECAQDVYDRLFCWILDCKKANISNTS